jgi:poly-gamma-glutamate synthesis protein (capsule biosynthesis protein)
MPDAVTVFLCGDVMTGRGIDQIQQHPVDPCLFESNLTSALGYVELAERLNGPIARPVDDAYIWGDALAELDRVRPDVRVINLETAVTRSSDWEPKGINYRMSPDNIGCLTAARIDCCVLANNHVLDWGRAGLIETLDTLAAVGIRTAGAGINRERAEAPAILNVPEKGRVVVFSFGASTSGIPPAWVATSTRPGVNLLRDLSGATADRIGAIVRAVRRPKDIVVASIHWGGNWGYEIPVSQRVFARRLIDAASVDIVHGHSSHHPKPLEVYRGKLILYGCGDFLSDYEGIGGYEEFRNDLVLMYLPCVASATGHLVRLNVAPFRIRNFRLHRASRDDARWLRDVLNREGRPFGTTLDLADGNTLTLRASGKDEARRLPPRA